MNNSLRLRLLFILVGLFSLVWIFITTASYLFTRHEIEELFDAQLAQYARTLQGLTQHELDEEEHEDISLSDTFLGHTYEKKVAFQVWNGRVLVLHSEMAPKGPMSEVFGFSDQTFNGALWRVFVLPALNGASSVHVAEQYDVRNELVGEISLQILYPLIIALPLLASMIWFAVGRGLRPLRRITAEVGERSPVELQPLSSDHTPSEIEPLVAAINRLLNQLRMAFESERRFTADAAHELRTPLAILKVQAQVAQGAQNNEERVVAVGNILKGVDRATRLVEQLLTLARLDPDSSKKQFEYVELAGIAERVIGEQANTAVHKNIDLGLEEDSCGYIYGYPDALEVMLRNLVDNAVKYTPNGGRVDVSVHKRGDNVVLSVVDTGPGIDEELRSRVFDRFYRVLDTKADGCGLGLSIVQRIAELHHADITLGKPGSSGFKIIVTFSSAAR
jgi:two-component system, OmpR family, sensor histidine kinase QseC